MKIILATDHAGFEMKEQVKAVLLARGFEILDCGAETYHASDDYPMYMHEAARQLRMRVQDGDTASRSIVFGGSGTGEAIVMNRYHGVRTIVYNGQSIDIVALGRQHNDANCLAIGARFVNYEDTLEVIEIFLATDFEAGRHIARVQSIEKMS